MPQTTTAHLVTPRGRGRHPRRRLEATRAPAPFLELQGVTARTSGGRVLLDDVSFSVRRGWLIAVVGPTGAGKTSLARALTGAQALEAGSIRLDGRDLTSADGIRRERIAYVPQDDVLHGQLELGRMLSYAASLRVPAALGEGERRRRTHSVLAELGLEQHADVPISQLSGGQRKRANIAAELVGRPDVLVLDEPTSGLDPGYEKSVMATLRDLADGGRTVITVTHSMQALACCDRVLFLAEGGRVAYFGPPARVSEYFGRADAADVF
ncbi:MAG: ABC transporter ATP-binding protein, partial [Acidimicrobiales bacterium]|nr:ABC transporter ATP-binding protein [Acidimicrobiales bacterium]